MKKLTKNFVGTANTIEKYSARVACYCSAKCNCSCQNDQTKSGSNKATGLSRDSEAYSNVYKR